MSLLEKLAAPEEEGEITSGVWLRDTHGDFEAMTFALHDAKNVACALEASLEWLRSASLERPREEVAATVEEMTHACRTLSEMLVGALREARAGGSGLALRTHREPVHEILQASLRRFQHRAEARGVRLIGSVGPAVFAEIDAELVGRVVDNLLDNAVRVSPECGTVMLLHERLGDELLISVSDQGPGIAEGEQAGIFELFASGESGAGPASTGVGLAFARRVAEAHGGWLTVDSAPGDGATFLFRIPLARE